MKTAEICTDERRRNLVQSHKNPAGEHDLNGIDYVEISDDDQSVLLVHFLGKAPEVVKGNVRIEGGRRIRGIKAIDPDPEPCSEDDDLEPDNCLRITLNKAGDFSTYTLRLVETDAKGQPTDTPLHGFDPRYAQVKFSFKANCSSDLDCQTDTTCPPTLLVEPEINYLARDYASFRQLILDRLSLIMPDWQERHVPDLGITLVEILAYVGDHLSYYQDAVATEAYLETARQRISVRRHVRLVDYSMHEGCNARAWVFIETSTDITLDPQDTYFISSSSDVFPFIPILTDDDLRTIPADNYEVFEPLLLKGAEEPIHLYTARNEIPFYTWSDQQCCLPPGATTATLRDALVPVQVPPGGAPAYTQENSQAQMPAKGSANSPPDAAQASKPERELRLQPGNVLFFEEVLGPKTGNPADADPAHRHIVRLTRVQEDFDMLYDPPVPVLEIEWAEEDALPFPLCLSAIGPAPDCQLLDPISVARGNVILVDAGQTLKEFLGSVEGDTTPPECEGVCDQAETMTTPRRFIAHLQHAPLTFSVPLPGDAPFFHPQVQDTQNTQQTVSLTSASNLLIQDPRKAIPWIKLTGKRTVFGNVIENDWTVEPDLLSSHSDDYHFVVEMDNDGDGHLRFGDGELGHLPEAGTEFTATYRVGNGLPGNVGAETITHIVFHHTKLDGVLLQPRNPLPATGGTAPEPLAEVKLFTPRAFRSDLQRAITTDDYARLAERNPRVKRAAAILNWTGDWYEVLVAIQQRGKEEADQDLLNEVEAYLEHYRRVGHDLIVVSARTVPLDIAMNVCVLPHYQRGHVKAALLDTFSNRLLPDGRRGFFHPDNLSFGDSIPVSKLIAIAQAVQGVQSVTISKLERLNQVPNDELENGVLPIGPMEIAQLDNDPSFPENGKLTITIGGGR